MKRLLLIVFLLGSKYNSLAQNLVQNYSFENYTSCPVYPQFTGYINNWEGGFPSYFNENCLDPNQGSVPQNGWGYQYPLTGIAYSGVYTFTYPGKDTTAPAYQVLHDLRDYLQGSLLNSLNAGTKYYVTFYVNLGDSCKYACNNIGTYFSDSALVYSTSRKVKSYLTPQVENDTSNHLTDKINWMKVSGSFIAKGGEQYIVIGNFKDDAQSDTLFVNTSAIQPEVASFYYIDDVIVTTDSNYADSLLTSVKSISQPKEVVQVYPNPSTGIFTFNIQGNTSPCILEIYNMLGENVYNSHFSTTTTQIDLSGRLAGIYLYRLINTDGEAIASGKLIIQ